MANQFLTPLSSVGLRILYSWFFEVLKFYKCLISLFMIFSRMVFPKGNPELMLINWNAVNFKDLNFMSLINQYPWNLRNLSTLKNQLYSRTCFPQSFSFSFLRNSYWRKMSDHGWIHACHIASYFSSVAIVL